MALNNCVRTKTCDYNKVFSVCNVVLRQKWKDVLKVAYSEIFRKPADQLGNFGFAVWQSVPVQTGVFHQHNDIEVVKMEAGAMNYLYGGHLDTLNAGSISVFWAATPHQVLARSEDAFCRGISVPLKWFLERQLPEPFTLRLLHSEVILATVEPSLDDFSELTTAWMEDMEQNTDERRFTMYAEMDAWFRRLALLGVTTLRMPEMCYEKREHPGEPLGDAFRSMVDYVSNHYAEFVTTEEITAASGLDHEQAMGLFRQRTGDTLVEFLNRQRLAFAQLLLITTNLPVIDIAMESGFQSASRFYALFKEKLGLSPLDFRETYAYIPGDDAH